MPTALVQGSIAVQYLHLLQKNLATHWNILNWDPEVNSQKDFMDKAKIADVIIGGKIPLEKWPKLPKLKMFQIPDPLEISPTSNTLKNPVTNAET